MVCPQGDSFEDATDVVRELNKIVNNYWRGPWISYSSAPKEVKDLWWNEFKRKFSWDKSQDSEIRRIFKKKAGDHIRNVMNKAKTKKVKPHFITGEDWTEMNRTWEGEKMKQRSEQNAKNRASRSSEGSSTSATYAGGSINIGEHRKRLAHDLGTETTYAATFERVFQKKDKTWVGDRAKSVKEKYDELLMSAASGDDGGDASSQAADNMAMWVEASGGVKRGKIYGWGNLSRELVAKDDGSSSSNAAASRRRRIDEETAQQVSRLTLLLAEKDEQMKRQEERLSQKDDQIRYLQAQMAMVLQTST
ncbi:uncharacterized protein LOC115733800 isoform X1 [Rhodamnia argentea]|uniref:Uncharacterized protein LOC115733800 isoform X1 n=1 Tax=Rhodamnia argentea TaxID=178133 RepID=A0ABM3H866_9MYRT|nr:uncharacterized protein LOC115733800 isoform X1 [Rhodamnia argentea]